MLHKKKIFIVDDDLSVRKSLVRLLESSGFDASEYGSGDEFLKKVPPQSSGCLILDIHMPGLSGLELQEKIEAQGFPLVTIFITADKSSGFGSRVYSSKVAACLQKPFTRKQLTDLIQSAFKSLSDRERTGKSRLRRKSPEIEKSFK